MKEVTKRSVPWLIVLTLGLTSAGLGYKVLTDKRTEGHRAGTVEAEAAGTLSRLRNHVSDDEARLDNHDARLDQHSQSLARHGVVIEVIREGQSEIKKDIKEILRRLPRSP